MELIPIAHQLPDAMRSLILLTFPMNVLLHILLIANQHTTYNVVNCLNISAVAKGGLQASDFTLSKLKLVETEGTL